jgi:NCAIR mutase (PurE)-related protein
MNEKSVRELLESVKTGDVSVGAAVSKLATLPYEDLGFAKVDHHRQLRTGFPEVVFGMGKTDQQITAICESLNKHNNTVIVTRVEKSTHDFLERSFPQAQFHAEARMITFNMPERPTLDGEVIVVSAGTSDLPIAAEALQTAKALGCSVNLVQDVGVAGIHRLVEHMETLRAASAIIVVAGMDGALPSAIGGLVDTPVIAVPTSVGYGAAFEGLSALLAMLNSCASGVAVMNIDNGFGAGFFAGLMLKKSNS